MTRRLPFLTVLATALLALSACGSSSQGAPAKTQIRAAISEAFAGTSPTACTQVLDARFLQALTGQSGQAAVKACEQGRVGKKTAHVTVVQIAQSGSEAVAAITLKGRQGKVDLVSQGGRWKLDSLVWQPPKAPKLTGPAATASQQQAIRQTLVAFINAAHDHDARTYCRLESASALKSLTGVSGPSAMSTCVKALQSSSAPADPSADTLSISDTHVNGKLAETRAALDGAHVLAALSSTPAGWRIDAIEAVQ